MIGVNEFKQSRLYQDIKLEGLEEGEQQGRLEGKLELVPQLLARGLSVEEIAEMMGLTVEQVGQAWEE